MLSVASKPFMLIVNMLNVVAPPIVALSQSYQCRIRNAVFFVTYD